MQFRALLASWLNNIFAQKDIFLYWFVLLLLFWAEFHCVVLVWGLLFILYDVYFLCFINGLMLPCPSSFPLSACSSSFPPHPHSPVPCYQSSHLFLKSSSATAWANSHSAFMLLKYKKSRAFYLYYILGNSIQRLTQN